jgi:hypothetical protein
MPDSHRQMMLRYGTMEQSRLATMSRSGISTTKSETATLDIFASLRFTGDRLEPGRVTRLLRIEPTIAYRKGEVYKRSRGHEVIGRTGLWLLSSEGRVSSNDLRDHLAHLWAVIYSATGRDLVSPLQELMREDGLEADISCFWYGEHGASPPVIPHEIRAAFAQIGATIETDFDTD